MLSFLFSKFSKYFGLLGYKVIYDNDFRMKIYSTLSEKDFNKSNKNERNSMRQKRWHDRHIPTRKIKQIKYRESWRERNKKNIRASQMCRKF